MENERNYPTMIIPRGTEIAVNEQGLLSIKTPGNLVIQNPGVYSMIECGNGSVRIDPNIKVEAISINAADPAVIVTRRAIKLLIVRDPTMARGFCAARHTK